MRDFFKSELETLKIKTNLNQYERLCELPNAKEEIKLLFDLLEKVCNEFPYIPEDQKKRIIQTGIYRDTDFTGLTPRIVWKWLNAESGKYFREDAHKPIEQTTPVPYDELKPEIKIQVDEFIKMLSDESTVKSVPGVSQAEIDSIKLEDLEEREGRKSIAPVRPEWIVGEPCQTCNGDTYIIGSKTEPDCCGNVSTSGECKSYCAVPKQVPTQEQCPVCEGTGEINRVIVHASSLEEARKAYNATFKK